MATRRASQLTIAYHPQWQQQSAWDVPIDGDELIRAFPATSRNYFDINETNEDVFNCTGEDFLFEILTASFARLTIDFDVDPDVLVGVVAGAYGVAASPTGGSNEVQTETITATSGTRRLTVQTGANAQTTADIPFDASAATIQAALELLTNVGAGDIVVSGSGPYVYTFANALQKQDVQLIQVNTYGLVGGTSTFVETTPGIGLLHTLSRITGYTLPLFTFYVGFRGSDKQPVIFKNVIVNSIRVRSASREKVSATVELIGSSDFQYATGFTMPDCTDILPLRFSDCQTVVGGVDFNASNIAREFEYYFQNDVNPRFDGSAVFSTRHERADQRPSGFNIWLLGEPGDAIYNLALAKTTLDVYIRCGTAGRNVKFRSPQGFVKLAPSPIRFGGDPAESEIALVVRPKKVSGDSTTPTTVTANVSLQTVLLDIDVP
jgi:hypothetical protein